MKIALVMCHVCKVGGGLAVCGGTGVKVRKEREGGIEIDSDRAAQSNAEETQTGGHTHSHFGDIHTHCGDTHTVEALTG